MSVNVTPQVPTAVSRQLHGNVGIFDIFLPLTGPRGIECRGTNGNYTIVFAFPGGIASVDQISLRSGTIGGASSSFGANPRELFVSVTGVPSGQNIVIELNNVRDAAGGVVSASVPLTIGILLGDVNGNGIVTASDISQTKAFSGQILTGANFRADFNLSGTITASDISLAKSQAGMALP